MNITKDPLLESIVKIAEALPPTDPHEVFHVTLVIGGMLVTGRIISHDEFIRHHVFVERLWDKYPRPLSELPPHKRLVGEEERWCLHLADATFSLPGQAPTAPAVRGIYWRARLSEVAGFSFVKPDQSSAAPGIARDEKGAVTP